MKILVLTYESGLVEYIRKDETALDFILNNFHVIDEIVEVEQAQAGGPLEPSRRIRPHEILDKVLCDFEHSFDGD